MGNAWSCTIPEQLKSFEKWNDLPPEIKSECIKKLDFKTRFLLRSTSRTERALVDAQNYNLHQVKTSGVLPYPMNCIIPSGRGDHKLTIIPSIHSTEIHVIHARNHTRFVETILPLLIFILKTSTIDMFSIEVIRGSNWRNILGDLLEPNSLNIKSFHGVVLRNQETLYFISRLTSNTQFIHLDANSCKNFPIDDLIEYPIIKNAQIVQIRDMESEDAVWKMAEKWIENDSDVGTTLRVTSRQNMSIPQFSSKFEDRIISTTQEEVRIKTDNPSKHILLKLAKQCRITRPVTCVVISAEMNQNEFESFGKWVTRKVMPIWEYISIVLREDFHEDDGLNITNLLILLIKCLCIILITIFQNMFSRN